MKRLFKWMFQLFCLLAMIAWQNGCASTQQQPTQDGEIQGDVATPGTNEESAPPEEQQNATQSEFSEKNASNLQQSTPTENVAPDTGEGVNNAAAESFVEESATPPVNDANVSADQLTATQATKDETAAATLPTTPQSQSPGVAAASPAPQTGGIVKYIPKNGVNVYSTPQASTAVKQLEQGDHPLVFEEGQWARTHDGMYISQSELNSAPVGRVKVPKAWK